MTIEELKKAIEERAGVPASFLTGETLEENIAQAKALLAFKKERGNDPQQQRSAKDQFADWLDAQLGIEPQDAIAIASAALAEIEEATRNEALGYPIIKDAGQIPGEKQPDFRSTHEQFTEWFNIKISER